MEGASSNAAYTGPLGGDRRWHRGPCSCWIQCIVHVIHLIISWLYIIQFFIMNWTLHSTTSWRIKSTIHSIVISWLWRLFCNPWRWNWVGTYSFICIKCIVDFTTLTWNSLKMHLPCCNWWLMPDFCMIQCVIHIAIFIKCLLGFQMFLE